MDATLARLWSLGLNESSQHDQRLLQQFRVRRVFDLHPLQFVVPALDGFDRLKAEQRTKTF